MQANSHIHYNFVSLAFDENSLIKAPIDPPKFIGNSKYGSGFDDIIPRSICTDQQFYDHYQPQNDQDHFQFMMNEAPKFSKHHSSTTPGCDFLN